MQPRPPRCFSAIQFSVLCLVVIAGCAYPRRSTAIQAAQLTREASTDVPDNLWSLTIISAEVPREKRTGLDWDSDGTQPDPLVRLIVDGRLVWESPVKENENSPEWNITLPRNVLIDRSNEVRLELWDRDHATAMDPIGFLVHRGLPGNALPDAVARVALDAPGAVITMRVSKPRPHRGTGITLFELRPDAVLLVSVEPLSPAARAGLVAGDWIMSIDGKPVEGLGDAAVGMLSMAAARGYTLLVRDSSGRDRSVELDRGFIWLTM